MRELKFKVLKFKVWDKLQKCWSKNMMEWYHNEGVIIPAIENRYVFVQFTGLTDRNSNPIYEGDIIMAEAIDADGHAHTIQGTIEWDPEECGFALIGDGKWPIVMMRFITQTEVIGNIFEHGRLLEG